MDQTSMPILEMLQAYEREKVIPFHMPGHKHGKGFQQLGRSACLTWDITEFHDSDNLHDPQGAIRDAQILAAEAFGAKKTFFLVNGSSVGIMAMILSAVRPGGKIIIPRNSHKSVLNGIVLGDLEPVYVFPELDEEHALLTGVSVQSIIDKMDEHPDADAVLVTYPNYYGMAGNLQEIEKEVHARGKLLLVDEAHGAHFPFSHRLPPSSSLVGADMWVQSAHKTLPALTQSAYLHVGTDRIDVGRVQRNLQLLHTTSPSYLLMASLDWARHIMSCKGEEMLERLFVYTDSFRSDVNRNEKLYCFGNEWIGRPGVSYMDETRLVIDVRKTGYSGYEMEQILRSRYHIQVEMSDCYRIVAITSVADKQEDLEALKNALLETARSQKADKPYTLELPMPHFDVDKKISPKQAFYSIIEERYITESVGRISAASIGIYPPGIPLLVPGEEISKESIDYLLDVEKAGGRIFGWTDPIRRTIAVI